MANKNPNKSTQFQKGHAPNGAGRKKIPDDIKAMFAAAAPDAVRGLIDLAKNSENEKIRMDAYKEILDRHLGKAQQAVSMDVSTLPKITFVDDLNDGTEKESP